MKKKRKKRNFSSYLPLVAGNYFRVAQNLKFSNKINNKPVEKKYQQTTKKIKLRENVQTSLQGR
jgi:hypothetical protein